MKVLFPDTKKLHIEFLINYGKEFLKLNKLSVGDNVELEFDYQKTSNRYKSREIDLFNYTKLAIGILKLDYDGCLYAESIDNLRFYEYTKHGKGYYYKEVYRPSIKKFGVGFIYK